MTFDEALARLLPILGEPPARGREAGGALFARWDRRPSVDAYARMILLIDEDDVVSLCATTDTVNASVTGWTLYAKTPDPEHCPSATPEGAAHAALAWTDRITP